MPRWRVLAAAAALAVYALISWALMTWWPASPWAAAALFTPLLVPLLVAGIGKHHKPSLWGAAALLLILATELYRGGVDMHRLYVLQHAGIHALLGWGFAITLRPGATPLITMMAERIHGVLTPAMRDYTRALTAFWVLYFVAMIGASFALYLLAPWPWWSFYYSVLTPLAVALCFVVEHVLRYQRHPEFERVSFAQVAQAWRARGAERPSAPPPNF
jgi:uncharacterized membrane protein